MNIPLVNIPRSNTDQYYRYKMPVIQVKIEGKGNGVRTVVTNMEKVMKALDRPMEYGVKFISIELGTKSQSDPAQHLCRFGGNHSAEALSVCLDKFIDLYVLCAICKNPETVHIIKNNEILSKCKACGKIHKVDSKHKIFGTMLKNEIKPVIVQKEKVIKKVIDDNDVWSLDTSDKSVTLRKQQLISIEDKSNVFPPEKFSIYIAKEPSQDDFIQEMNKLKMNRSWSETRLIKYMFAALFDKDYKLNFYKKINYVNHFIQSDKDMMLTLQCIEQIMIENESYLNDVINIINGLYEEEIVDEEVIIKWYNTLNESTLKNNVTPFIEWLYGAEEIDYM